MKLECRIWDATVDEAINLFRLTAADGAYIELSNLGATWVAASMPDADGRCADVLAGYPSLQGYLDDTCYMGATIGRYANRLSAASVSIEGVAYRLEANDGANTNHGGFRGWNRRIWDWCEIPSGIRFSLVSPHLEGGFPGEVTATVDYTFADDHTVTIRHRATTDRPTHVNMTNHAYFNLSGTAEVIDDHRLQIFASRMLDTDAAFIPTGKSVAIEGTPFDFSAMQRIGDLRHLSHPQLEWNRGYNHCYLLDNTPRLHPAAVVSHPATGRRLTVTTTYPAVLFYSAGYLESSAPGKLGVPHVPSTALCLETQFYPDAPAHENFPSTLLCQGQIYDHTTNYKFDTVRQ